MTNNKHMNLITAIGTSLIVLFLAFTVHRIYVYTPENFSTKTEVKELKGDICDKLSEMKSIMAGTNAKLDWLIQQHVKP